MGADFKKAFTTFIQKIDDGANAMDSENPYKWQLTKMVCPRKCKEDFNKDNATVYYKPKDGAWKSLETSSTSGGSGYGSFEGHTHKIPDETQFGEVWSADAEANAPNAVYDCAIDPDLVLWVWTEDGPNKVVSKDEPQVAGDA